MKRRIVLVILGEPAYSNCSSNYHEDPLITIEKCNSYTITEEAIADKEPYTENVLQYSFSAA